MTVVSETLIIPPRTKADNSGKTAFVLMHSRLQEKYPITLFLFFGITELCHALCSASVILSDSPVHFSGRFLCLTIPFILVSTDCLEPSCLAMRQ